jgi:hypothetical protein
VAASFVLVSLIVGAGWISRAARQTDGAYGAMTFTCCPRIGR